MFKNEFSAERHLFANQHLQTDVLFTRSPPARGAIDITLESAHSNKKLRRAQKKMEKSRDCNKHTESQNTRAAPVVVVSRCTAVSSISFLLAIAEVLVAEFALDVVFFCVGFEPLAVIVSVALFRAATTMKSCFCCESHKNHFKNHEEHQRISQLLEA
jgi:hypothetical protein